MLTGQVTVFGWLKKNLNRGCQAGYVLASIIQSGPLKGTVSEQPYGGTQLDKSIKRLTRSRVSNLLIDIVQRARLRRLKDLSSFVIEGYIIATFAIKNQTAEVLAAGDKGGSSGVFSY